MYKTVNHAHLINAELLFLLQVSLIRIHPQYWVSRNKGKSLSDFTEIFYLKIKLKDKFSFLHFL